MALIPAILDYISNQELNKSKAEAIRQEGERWAVDKEKMQLAMKQQKIILDSIGRLPPEMQGLALQEPKLAGLLMMLGGGVANQVSQSTGGVIPSIPQVPTPEPSRFSLDLPELEGPGGMVGQQEPNQESLPGMIANRQLFAGMTPDDIVQDFMRKEYGIGTSTEPVKTEPMMNPTTGEWEIGQVLRNGRVRWTGQKVPQEIVWKEETDQTGQRVISVAYDKYGKRRPEFDRTNIQQPLVTTPIAGPGGLPANFVVPPGGIAPGTVIPQPAKGEIQTVTGPMGEKYQGLISPYLTPGGGVPKGQTAPSGATPPAGEFKAPAGFTQVAPPEPKSVPQAQQISMMSSGMEALKKVKEGIFDENGNIKWINLATGKLNIPKTEGKRIADLLGTALNAIRLASTGAAFSKEELAQLKSQYIPSVTANATQVYDQWELLNKFVYSMLNQMDPNEVQGKWKKEYETTMAVPGMGTVRFMVGNSEYNIPKEKVDAFIKQFPKARRLSP